MSKEPRPFEELRDSGLLWLVNAAVFHPRGFALAWCYDAGKLVGWRLHGDGKEPWVFGNTTDAEFLAAQETLKVHDE